MIQRLWIWPHPIGALHAPDPIVPRAITQAQHGGRCQRKHGGGGGGVLVVLEGGEVDAFPDFFHGFSGEVGSRA